MEYPVIQEVLTVEFLGFAPVRGYGIQVQFCGGRRVDDREVVDLVGRALCPKQGEQGGGYDLARWQKNNFDGFRECDNGCFADGFIGGDDLNARGVDLSNPSCNNCPRRCPPAWDTPSFRRLACRPLRRLFRLAR